MRSDRSGCHPKVDAIRESGLTIYDHIEVGSRLWLLADELEAILNASLRGVALGNLPLRTRSKKLKEEVCLALGYPVPDSFTKTQPRFPGQNFDTYVQKSNNLQIWNEEIATDRRYVLVHLAAAGVVACVKVVTGQRLAQLDTTGTLTRKFQATCIPGPTETELVTETDTDNLRPEVVASADLVVVSTPAVDPRPGEVLSIRTVFERLGGLVGQRFDDSGHDQERNRGAAVHHLVCRALGYSTYQDTGQFPDVRHQLLEVKLQTSPTIDLGLVRPNSTERLDVAKLGGHDVRHCDVRYAVFYGKTDGKLVTLTHLIMATGEAFPRRFPLFEGKEVNEKLQIHLPAGFFDS